jgi:hypothetical protein
MIPGMDPREIMAATKHELGDIGAAFYFDPVTLERGKELGLSGMRFYALGRGGILGTANPAVVQSAFGYFHPELLAKWLTQAAEVMEPVAAARAYIACNHERGRRVFGDVPRLDEFVDAAASIIDSVDGGALALFAALRAEEVPDDAPAAAAHQAMVLRELRGSAHLAAVAAVGLPSRVAHAIKRPDDVGMFGYEDPPSVTDADRAALDEAEALTDRILEPAYGVLTDDQAQHFVDTVHAMHAALSG